MALEAHRRQNLEKLQIHVKKANKDMRATAATGTGTTGYKANAAVLSDISQAL
jgi:hypothetical protein